MIISKIEDALQKCSGDEFADICRQYLTSEYSNVTSPGFGIGKQKSKIGTPDILITLRDYYIFCQVTTQQQGILKKLKKDIFDCHKQTDISLKKIAKILLITNIEVPPKLRVKLVEYTQTLESKVDVEIIDLENLALRINAECPGICKQLGIPIDSGQIMTPTGFVELYGKSPFATALSNTFFNRTNEIKTGLEYLKSNNILLVTGDAGVGKTKLSLELTNQFWNENPDWQVKYISNNGDLNIWDDLVTQLTKNKNHVLVLDDANKLRKNLDQVFNFIATNKGNYHIKVVLTVRTYAAAEIERLFGKLPQINLQKFSHPELRLILKAPEFNISDYYIDRIYNISKGNARLAIMAATAGAENAENIRSAADIHALYFSNILHAQNIELDEISLQVAAVLALYRTLNFDNYEHIEQITSDFGLERKILIEKCNDLKKWEIADSFGNLYKIADQILGEYIFHQVFVDKRMLPFEKILDFAYDRKSINIKYLLQPIIANYDSQAVKTKIISDLRNKWNQVKSCEPRSLRFLKDFWFYLPNETLMQLSLIIGKIPAPDTNDFKFSIYKDNHVQSYDDEIFDLLIGFKDIPEKFHLALELLTKYGLKSENNFSKYLKAFSHSFTYGVYSDLKKYTTQISSLEFLYTKTSENQNFYSRVILFVAPSFLKSTYETHRGDGSNIYIDNKPVTLIDGVKDLRKKLIEFVFDCIQNPLLKNEALNCLQVYVSEIGYRQTGLLILKFDKSIILPLIKRVLNPSEYSDCFIVNLYADNLRRSGISFDKKLQDSYRCHRYKTYLTMNTDYLKRRETLDNQDDFEKNKLLELRKYTSAFLIEDYLKLFVDLDHILVVDRRFSRQSPLHDSVAKIFLNLSISNPTLFIECLNELFKFEFSKDVNLHSLFRNLVYNTESTVQIRAILNREKNAILNLWPFWFFLPQHLYSLADIQILKQRIEDKSFISIWAIDSVISKISGVSEVQKEINELINLLLSRVDTEPQYYLDANFFIYVFENHSDIFESRFDDLKTIYIYCSKDSYFDFELKIMAYFQKRDCGFIVDYLIARFPLTDYFSRREIRESHLYKLWERDIDHPRTFTQILDYFKYDESALFRYATELTVLFTGKNEKEMDFLKKYATEVTDSNALRLSFNIVQTVFSNQKFDFLDLMLRNRISFDTFCSLSFHIESSMVYSGSYIPRIKGAISELKSFKIHLEKKGSLEYLEHISFLEKEIENEHRNIEFYEKREFLSAMGY